MWRARRAPGSANLSWRYLTQAAVDHRGKARDLDGTLYFSGDGNVFDQILVARGLLAGSGARARVESARIEAYPEMVDHRVGEGADPLRLRPGRRRAQRECGWLQRSLPGVRAHRRSGLIRRRTSLGRRRITAMAWALPGSGRENNNRCIRGKEFNFSDFELRYISTHNDAPSGDRTQSCTAWTGPQEELLPDPARQAWRALPGEGHHAFAFRRGRGIVLCRPFHLRAPAAQGKNPLSLAYNIKPWTGDLDGMKKRQQVRVLVPYNKTLYFLDKGGTQRGLIVDMMTEFEKRLNAGVKAHYARIHVVFLPTPRDRLIRTCWPARATSSPPT